MNVNTKQKLGTSKMRPTKRAPDAGDSAPFQTVSYALAFFWLDGFAVPAPAQVTHTVGCFHSKGSNIMAAKRAFIIFAIIAIVGAGLFAVKQNKQPTPAELLKAEQEVYAVLLSDQKNAYNTDMGTFQIVEFTNSGQLQASTPESNVDYTVNMNIDELPELERETLLDYKEKNKASVPIKGYLPPTVNVMFVNPSNSEQLYWWVSFSRIGFNLSLTQALVLVGDCRGESCYDSRSNSMYSQGHYRLLQKKNGTWLIQDYQNDWLIEAPAP